MANAGVDSGDDGDDDDHDGENDSLLLDSDAGDTSTLVS